MLKLNKINLAYYFCISILIIAGLFFKTYKQTQLLGFYYDQGRDALAARQILSGHPKLTGPVSGIEGVLLGPFWFYLITPFYFISKNPGVAATLFSLLDLVVIYFSYQTFKLIFFRTTTGHKLPFLIWLVIYLFSWEIIKYWRWFSNPTSLLILQPIIIFLTLKLFTGQKINLFLYGFLLGLSFQTELASAGFFPLILIIIYLVFKKHITFNFKDLFNMGIGIVLTLIPQLLFDLRHQFLISKSVIAFLTGHRNTTSSTFSFPSLNFLLHRLKDYSISLGSILIPNNTSITFIIFYILILSSIFLLVYFYTRKTFYQPISLIIFWLLIPLLILLFFVGNYGHFYSYYLIGLIIPFTYIISYVLTLVLQQGKLFKYLLIPLVFCFLFINTNSALNYLQQNPTQGKNINLYTQTQAIQYLCQQPPPVKVFFKIPPVIPYSYRYLIKLYCPSRIIETTTFDSPMIYTVYELSDFGQFETQILPSWLKKLNTFTTLKRQKRFGGVVVEQRIIKHHD